MKIEIYGKDNCPNCVKAKNLCKLKSLYFDYFTFGVDYTKEELENKIGSPVTSVPQIFIDDVHIGGFNQLMEKLR